MPPPLTATIATVAPNPYPEGKISYDRYAILHPGLTVAGYLAELALRPALAGGVVDITYALRRGWITLS